jgi:tetratricopeptide (TPR) repeat protein
MRPSVLSLALLACGLVPALAQGQAAHSDIAAQNRALIQRLVLDRAAAIAAAQRLADEREEKLFAELAAKDRRLRAERRTLKATQDQLAQVTAERQCLVDEIAARDRQFAAEIAEYRRQVASIANSPDPRKRAALERYAEGDRSGAFEVLVAIQEAETKAVAAGWREIAALATDRKDRGEMETAQVIQVHERAQSLDAGYAWGWIELRRLYHEAGRLPDARCAAEQALAHAQDPNARVAAEVELGDVLMASGDLAAARARFEASLLILQRLAEANPDSAQAQRDLGVGLNRFGNVLVPSGEPATAREQFEDSLQISQRLAEANPNSAQAQRDLSLSLNRLGEVLVVLGELTAARARFEASLLIRQRLAEANPNSAQAQRDLSLSLEGLGNVLVRLKDLTAAQKRFEDSLAIRQRLAKANPTSAQAQRDLSLSLNQLGDVLVRTGNLAAAREQLEASLLIRQRLAKANPTSAQAQRDLGLSLEKLGNVLVESGDLAGARKRFEESLTIRQRLAETNPTSAEAQRDLSISHLKLGELPGGEHHSRIALKIALELQSSGRLAPSDSWWVDKLRQKVETAEHEKP